MKNLQVRIKTDLTNEPVTLAEAKQFCKITGTAEDATLNILIKSARRALEKYTSSSFGEKTIYATWLTMPDILELPYGPIISVNNIYWIDEEGTEEELTLNSDYWVYGDQDCVLKVTKYWTTGLKTTASIRAEYTAGYGDDTNEPLPEELRLAILKQVATEYEMREDISPDGGVVLSNASKRLANPYRKKVWF